MAIIRWVIAAALAVAVLMIASHLAPSLDRELDRAIAFAALLTIISVGIATDRGIRWSVNRAAVLAFFVYLALIPAMTSVPIDGDEPYYLLVTDSLVHDHDLDLRNQYRDAERLVGRPLQPQPSDPVGKNGEQYSRHEPFLPLLMAPAYAAAGLPGALATIALFAALALRSTLRLLEDEGIDDATIRAVFPFIAFGPPMIFFAARIWPEAPAAFAFVETLRGVRQRRPLRWVTALFALVLLKIRFVLVAIMIGVRTAMSSKRSAAIVAGAIALAILIVWLISGSVINVHSWEELQQFDPRLYLRGIFGLMLDGAGGLLFQAPFYLIAIFAIARWKETPEAFRLGWLFASLYLFLLVPRSEWHGGWSPPLRYVTFFMPVLALGAAWMWKRVPAPFIALTALWTAGLVAHGVAYPWRLFHIASGENALGEWLSSTMHADFSRLFPSFIRPNTAAFVAAVILAVVYVVTGFSPSRRGTEVRRYVFVVAVASLILVLAFRTGMSPASRVEFEDAHVIHNGGELYPEMYTVARFNYRGGWILHANQSLSFTSRGGRCALDYAAPEPVVIQAGAAAYHLDATGNGYSKTIIDLPHDQRIELKCLSGTINLDRLTCD